MRVIRCPKTFALGGILPPTVLDLVIYHIFLRLEIVLSVLEREKERGGENGVGGILGGSHKRLSPYIHGMIRDGFIIAIVSCHTHR